MKLKSLLAATLVAVGAVAANAATSDLGQLTPTITQSGGGATSFGAVINDNFTFSLSEASWVQSNVTTVFGNLNPAFYGIYTAGLDSVVGTPDDDLVIGYGFNAISKTNFDSLAAGSYYFKVFAQSNTAFSAYGLSATATALPVPEPETYALLAAGLGMIGFLTSRRRRDF